MGITIHDLEVTFTGTRGEKVSVLDIGKLEFQDGQQRCLVGGSGSGKTTLLNVIAGITLPTRGSVLFGDEDITRMPEAKRDLFRARNIGYVFQTFNLIQSLTARENVLVAMGFAGNKGPAAAERAEALLKRMGLADRMHARPGTLSVGEQQRVAIARAVANTPNVVLADEPTANLDDENGDEVLDLLREVASEEGSILALVTHEARVRDRFDDVLALSEISRCPSGV